MTDGTSHQPQYLTVPEVAEDLRVSPMTVYRLIARGDILAIQVGRRTYRVSAPAYQEYKRQRHADADARAQARNAARADARAHQAVAVPGQTEAPF